MTDRWNPVAPDVEIDVRALLMPLLRALPYLIVFAGLVGVVTVYVLARLPPEYKAETSVLIQGGQSAALDNESITSQIQLIRSRDVARSVVQRLDLAGRPEYQDAIQGNSFLGELLARFGLAQQPSDSSVEERILARFYDDLQVSAIADLSLIAIDVSSTDPKLAADGANAVAAEYVALQRVAREDTAADATTWLEAEIANLRTTIRDSRTSAEAAAQRGLLDSYLGRYREALARQNADYFPADARIISRASVPIEPDFPKVASMTAAATAAALLLGIAFVVVREFSSGRPMRRAAFGRPLPMVPGAVHVDGRVRWADDHGVRRMMSAEPSIAPRITTDAERSLAAIASRIVAGGKGRVLVTLADGDGETGSPLSALALARALARADRRVVLINLRGEDANGVAMGQGRGLPGFADLFAGDASFAQVIFRDRTSRAHFIPAGRKPVEAAALTGERLATLLTALDHTYDHLILDVGDDMVAVFGSTVGAAMVSSAFSDADPRTVRAVERVAAAAPKATVLLFIVDPSAATSDDLSDLAVVSSAGAAA